MENINCYCEKLNSYKDIYVERANGLMQPKDNKKILLTMDIVLLASMNRALKVISGFIEMLVINNYCCAMPLVRIQQDNVMRLYAFYLVKDANKLASQVINGDKLDNIKINDNGKQQRLTDSFLSMKVSKIQSGFRDLYQNLSGYVHLSEKHIQSTINEVDNLKCIVLSDEDDYIGDDLKLCTINDMLDTSKLHLKIIDDLIDKGTRFKKDMIQM